MYFFNTTTCQPISQTQDIDRPTIGGGVNFFLVTKTSEQAASQLIFNHDNYAFKNTKKRFGLSFTFKFSKASHIVHLRNLPI